MTANSEAIDIDYQVANVQSIVRDGATLRVALRNALYRVFGSNIPEVSLIFRDIEAGASIADASDALERYISELVQKERDDAQAVYKRDFSRARSSMTLPG